MTLDDHIRAIVRDELARALHSRGESRSESPPGQENDRCDEKINPESEDPMIEANDTEESDGLSPASRNGSLSESQNAELAARKYITRLRQSGQLTPSSSLSITKRKARR